MTLPNLVTICIYPCGMLLCLFMRLWCWNICFYVACVDIIVSLYVCRDEFWSTSWSSFRRSLWRTMNVLSRMLPDGNPRGFSDPRHYRGLIYLMVNVDVIWRPYEDRRDITPLQDTCWYSGWIMVGKDRRCLHLPDRVLGQYGYFPIGIGAYGIRCVCDIEKVI